MVEGGKGAVEGGEGVSEVKEVVEKGGGRKEG